MMNFFSFIFKKSIHLRKISLSFLIINLAILSSLTFADDFKQKLEKEFTPLIKQAMKDWTVPGTAIVVIQGDEIIYKQTLGVTDCNTKEPVTDKTLFQAASLTKNFTAVLAGLLVDQGKLLFDQHISDVLPQLELSNPEETKRLTIQDLLSHNNRLETFSGDNLTYLGWHQGGVIEGLKHYPLKHETPKFSYQNVLYGLVGVIIEKTQKESLVKLFHEMIFKPLNMPDAYIFDDSSLRTAPDVLENQKSWWEKIKNFINQYNPFKNKTTYKDGYPEGLTISHDRFQGQARALPYNTNGFTFSGTSGLHININDFAQWLKFQLSNKTYDGRTLLNEHTFHKLCSKLIPVKTSGQGTLFPASRVREVAYGMGCYIHDYNGITVLTHMGGMKGTRTFMAVIPDQKIAIGILSNLGGMRESYFPEVIRNYFLDLLTGAASEEWSKIEKAKFDKMRRDYQASKKVEKLKSLTPVRPLKDYVGTYENKLFGKIHININKDSTAGNRLELFYKSKWSKELQPIILSHWNGNEFSFEAEKLGPGFSADYEGELYFLPHEARMQEEPISALWINILHEGKDAIFKKIN